MAVLVNGMQAVLQFTQEGQILQNVLNFIRFGGFTDEEVVSVAEDLIGWWDTRLSGQVADNVTLQLIKARRLDEEDAPIFEVTTDLPNTADGGDPLPNNVTLSMSTRTGQAGRRNRGRIYHVGLRTADLAPADPNIIDPTAVGNLLTAYNHLLDDLTTVADTALCVFSRVAGTGLVVQQILCDGVVDSQRRRLPGRGR